MTARLPDRGILGDVKCESSPLAACELAQLLAGLHVVEGRGLEPEVLLVLDVDVQVELARRLLRDLDVELQRGEAAPVVPGPAPCAE